MKQGWRAFEGRMLRTVAIVLLSVAVAIVARMLFLGALGTRITWITFYPAVVIASYYGGWFAGLLSAAASCLVAVFGWSLFGDLRFINDSGDWLGLSAFLFNCAMISAVAEGARRARMRAMRAQAQAEAANHAKSVFLANMSHELRTPLNAILGFSGLMLKDPSIPPEHQRTIGIINRSGELLLRLINDVLDMAKIEAGRTTLEIATFDLRRLMKEIVELMRQRAEAKGLHLTLELTSDLPTFIKADEMKVRQVILNLVGNAMKFTTRGGVTLRLVTGQLNGSGRIPLCIEVEDTGAGIDTADQKRIFEPFVQLGHTSDQKGTGLGLTITRQFVELMGGVVKVDSVVGKGSKFRVEIQVEPAEAVRKTMVDRETPLGRMAPGQPEYRVLVVDDKAENSELLRELLERAGFQVRVADNGAQGVELFQSWRPHLIWMDWRMPVMDGLQATRRIRELEGGGDVVIIALSASVSKEERAQLLAAGANDFLPKPIQFGEILACMARQLGVRFVTDEPTAATVTAQSEHLDTMAISALPIALRKDLADALVGLDATCIAEAIHRVANLAPALGNSLDHHASQLEDTVILRALEACNDGNQV